MRGKPLSNVDTAWLRMEDPSNMMMITGVIVFGTPIDRERLKATIEHRLLRFDRFRQRVAQPCLPGGSFRWESDPDFDLDYHLQRATLAPPGDQAALQEVASLLASTQLDFSKPLWQFHLIEGYGDGCALVCRLHHCIGDGIALVQVLLSLTDPGPDAPWPVAQPAEARRQRRHPLKRLYRPARSACRTTRQVAGTLLHESWETLTHPSRVVDLARLGTSGTTAFGRLVLRWPDPKTVFKGPLGIPKRAAWSEPIPLTDVKTVGKRLGGTVNDVLLTAMTGGLRRYLQARGERVDGLNFRAVVPVNLRPPDAELELGNKFGLVFLSLPVGVSEPVDRLRELKRRMDGLKGSLEAPVGFGILNAIGMAPERIQDIVVNIFGTKGTAVMTNVIGPQEKIYLAGAPLEALMFWVPQSGRLGMGVSILSYAGQVWMGVITDEGLIPDPETIIAGFQAEFDELLALAQEPVAAPTVADMSARLDDVRFKLDAMLAERSSEDEVQEEGDLEEAASPAAPAPEGAPAHCQALTQAGKPCKNRPLPGSDYCRVHQEE
jgi:diacylglycerol O-acyltransferase